MLKRSLAVLMILACCGLVPARAEDGAAPFDAELQRLAEILGTLHYLRGSAAAATAPNGAPRCRR